MSALLVLHSARSSTGLPRLTIGSGLWGSTTFSWLVQTCKTNYHRLGHAFQPAGGGHVSFGATFLAFQSATPYPARLRPYTDFD